MTVLSMKVRQIQIGLSMIELLVALALSSFLILGVTQIFIDNRRSYEFQRSQAEIQDNDRFLMSFLEQELIRAGYRRQPDVDLSQTFPEAQKDGCNFAGGESIGWNGKSLCIRYQARDANDVDCLGSGLSATEKAAVAQPYNSGGPIFVEKLTFDAANKSLFCASSKDASQEVKQEILTGIAALHFEFGTGPATERKVDTYSLAANSPIRAVSYTALLQSEGKNLRDGIDNGVLAQWKSMYPNDKVTDSGELYQIARGTVVLRNLMP